MPCSSAALPAFLVTALTGLDNRYVAMVNDAVFVCSVREYLIDDMLIGTYRDLVAAKLGIALAYMSTVLMTIWVAYQGFMIISGANRQPILGLAFKTGKMVLILALVALVAGNSPVIADTVLDFQALVTAVVVDEGTDVYRTIDINLALAQVFNALIDGFVGGAQANAEGKSLTQMAGLVGQSGPAMLVSVMAIMAEISITLAIMLAPLFLFFLLFQQTSAMFWSWVKFLLGTMFSLAVLALVSGILLKMMMMYGATVLAGFFLNASALGSVVSVDVGGSAMRMAMLGALSTALLVMIPPLIMQFFNSGASFAAGAMMGAMGGGAAAGGVVGLAHAMGGQQQPAGVGASSGGSSARLETSREGAGAATESTATRNTQMALQRSGLFGAAGAGERLSYGQSPAPGSHGVASRGADSPGLAFLRQKQGSDEFRDPSYGSSRSPVEVESASDASMLPPVADLTYDPQRGVYVGPGTDAALANGAGQGGRLKVSQGASGTPVHRSDHVPVPGREGAPSRPEPPYGSAASKARTPR
jgi:type IV secretion system protein VirB6